MAPSIAELPVEAEPVQVNDVGSVHISKTDLVRIWQWNETLPPAINKSIHEIFVECAQKQPGAPAIFSWDGEITYGELDRLSTRLAHALFARIKVGTAVPLCFEKSMWTTVAVLGVMKAGCAFVLTDPSQPESRLRTIAAEVDATLVLTSQRHRELGSRIAPSAEILVVDSSFTDRLSIQMSPSLPLAHADATMYIIFTSGTTGKPKGVVISHSNYTSGAIPRADIVGYREHTRVLDFASYAFDVSIDCMLCTLATGGCICIPSEDDRVNNLSGAIRNMKVNMVHTTPSVARILDPDIIPSLEILGLGGEAISAHDASDWRQQTKVIIAYGPSECTVGCAFNNHVVVGSTYTSLGKGVGGLLWIVNPSDHHHLMPIGETGELLVEGPIVGQGYLNEPEKTAAVYIEDPVWLLQGNSETAGRHGRLYKTGDLVKYDPNSSGAIVFVGRKDQQVKIRGQRVELGEVEHHIRSRLSPNAAVAAEVIRPGGSGEPTLVAFIAGSKKAAGADDENVANGVIQLSPELRQCLVEVEKGLTEDVPKYMIPSAYIPLKEIPIMVSGKTDRKRLQAIGCELSRKELASLRVDAVEMETPRTEKERTLHQLWTTLLGEGPDLGLRDNFFALGGDSLKGMKLVAAARENGFSLTVADIFAHPTLAEMASRMSAIEQEESMESSPFDLIESGWNVEATRVLAARLCDVEPHLVEDLYPCTPLQEGLMALSAKFSEAYVAQRVLELPDSRTARSLQDAFNKAARDSSILRTRIIQIPGQGLMQVVVNDQITWSFGGDLKGYLTADCQAQMELGKPLIRYALINNEDNGSQHFVLTMHHALYDGWSMPLVVDRVNRALLGLSTYRLATFKHFVQYLCHVDRSSDEDFWRNILQGASTNQFPRLPERGYQTQADSLLEHYVPLTKASASTNTLATAIRAAWAIVASQYTEDNDVVFGETLTGRNAPILGVEQIEGPMITTVPVRVRVHRDSKCSELLDSIHQHAISRIPHEHLGLQYIRRLSGDAREACELRTGMVLHPSTGQTGQGLANGLVPADDAEAAREALKFNSYALMLVCTLDSSGFLTMASFDSRTVSKELMQMALEAFGQNVQQLCDNPDLTIAEIQNLTKQGQGEVQESSRTRYSCNKFFGNAEQGKIEEQPDNRLAPNGDDHESATTSKEVELIRIWGGILGVDYGDIGVQDSFFDLGGDSIGAMKLVSELRQSGFVLSVAQVFAHRRLRNMARCLQDLTPRIKNSTKSSQLAYSLLNVENPSEFVESKIRPLLSQRDWKILDVLPARQLQEIAVRGTTELPRYSARYELLFFDQAIDRPRLFQACRQMISLNEILRTVFVQVNSEFFAVPLEHLGMPIFEYSIDTSILSFVRALCDLDVQTLMPLGGSFVKFLHVQASDGKSCLIIRISHAQYDEMCLPIILRQLSNLYSNQVPEASISFSKFVHHAHNNAIPQSIPYWRRLLEGGTFTVIPTHLTSLSSQTPVSLTRRLSISHRPKEVTLATFPTAAWALTLAKRLKISDVTFGEVVSGRNLNEDQLTSADAIVGPCWQYIPFRIQFQSTWHAKDLLSATQDQHITSAPHSALSLSEILDRCVDENFDPLNKGWYDSVVHQAVQGVERLDFGEGSEARTETVYPHSEPLREWKIQSYVEEVGDAMTLEIVTFEGWKEMGEELLAELVHNFEILMDGGDGRLLDS